MSDELLDIAGKVIVITGASSGFGQFFAEALAQRGATIVMGARRLAPLQALAETIESQGGKALAVTMDVSSRESVVSAFEKADSVFGGVDVVVNNAGIAPNKPFLQLTDEDWDTTLDTNLKGAFLVSQVFAQRHKRRLGTDDSAALASIINIASILGERVAGNVAPYAASKAGLIQLTKAMALELAKDGIRVNAIAPGYVSTDINKAFFESEPGKKLIKRIPQRQLGAMKDLLGPLCLLASGASRYMTGSVIAVDGGHLVSSL
ncbi:2-deoxy-D-gluconate 3-dehydrogenase [Gammaproteobacteria bacterium 45_16_T64]|nr:2-deoxy-D-gluconate 3-dehydrogenase [Gammaproteobacteria bacterium 45_16_T64]